MLTVFIAVGEAQGFAAAAHRLGLSRAAVTRAIACLEMELGVELLRRTTRNVRLTEAGMRYLADIKDVVTQIAEVNDAATVSPKGTLVVAASELFGRFFVMPCIAEYLSRFPDVEVVGYFFDRDINPADESVDVAIGIGRLAAPGLRATPVGQVRRMLCASPDYLDRHGIPRHPGDLLRHTLIAVGENLPLAEWEFEAADGRMSVRLRPRLTVTSDDAAIAAAVSGLGLARVLSYQVAPHLVDGTLKRVLARFAEAACPVQVLCREENYGAPKVRHFVSLLVGRLRANKALH